MNSIFITILWIAWTQGLMDLTTLPLFYYYKEELKINVINISIIQSIIYIPWIFKPLFGYISDQYNFLGYNKKGYILIVCIIEFWGLYLLSNRIENYLIVVLINISNVFCIVFRNVLGEGIMVIFTKISAIENQLSFSEKQIESQKNVSYFFGARCFGSIISNFFSGYLIQYFDIYKSNLNSFSNSYVFSNNNVCVYSLFPGG